MVSSHWFQWCFSILSPHPVAANQGLTLRHQQMSTLCMLHIPVHPKPCRKSHTHTASRTLEHNGQPSKRRSWQATLAPHGHCHETPGVPNRRQSCKPFVIPSPLDFSWPQLIRTLQATAEKKIAPKCGVNAGSWEQQWSGSAAQRCFLKHSLLQQEGKTPAPYVL